MRITELEIPKNSGMPDGIQDLAMNRLGEAVLLAGPNGAGKSRILRRILWVAQQRLKSADIEAQLRQLDLYRRQLLAHPTNPSAQNWKVKASAIENRIARAKWLTVSDPTKGAVIVEFVPKTLELTDPFSLNKSQIVAHSKNIEGAGVGSLSAGVLPRIQHIQNQFWEVTHPNTLVEEPERQRIQVEYKRLEKYIQAFLATSLGRTSEGDATLFGFRLGEAHLSDGQRVLLQFCLAIYAQASSLDELILFMDEPENHLHPSVLLTTIDQIRRVAPNAQLWIATHSVPLLAHFEPDALWYVHNGAVQYAGRAPEIVLQGLLGSEEQIGRLETFLGLPAQFATIQYALECLITPNTVGSTEDDQCKQVTDALLRLEERSTPHRILDLGAGQGRMIGAIFERLERDIALLKRTIDYCAFDLDPKDSMSCISAIERVYGSSSNRYFNSYQKLLETLDEGSVSVTVLANVLHEIDPKNWLDLFSASGPLTRLTSDGGNLLIVEDQRIPKGELAYSKGFLVLDTLHLKRLFQIKESDTGFKVFDARDDGRLKAHAVPKRMISRVTSDSRRSAIESLAESARAEIARLRTSGPSYRVGLLHAFWVQQFTNARLALAEL